ncbi:tripartite tricarboxylate transporter permease [Oceanibium sediminis]|uniref:tripartite tricarboxylate transporter permease n=1 Tax=Oceanibium sediminis TaxID=2026339 RepID=UPI000DD41724|nr:tripartite tricarboxylate transporter permease [Oceanibium sediminis]
MDNILTSLSMIADPWVALALIVGTVFGVIVGALPGLGSILAITMVLPFTIAMGQVPAIALILAVYCSSVFGGSITAILINTPGTPQSAATVLDGHPMTRAGKANLAIGWATVASLIGGIFSAIVLIFAAPKLASFALRFGAIETFALICLSLTCIVSVSKGSLLKGLLAGVFGLFISTIGPDQMTGMVRLNFDIFELSGGFQLVPLVVGLFAFSEVFVRLSERRFQGTTPTSPAGFRFPSLIELARRWKTALKGSLIGTFVGILPGTGAATASFMSYAEARRSARFKEKLGQGEPEGIVASETANNAVTGGALVPTLALGIPGDPVTAVMMTALIMQGIQPGVRLFADNPELMNAAFMVLILANIAMLIVAIFVTPFITRVLRLPEPLLLAIVMLLSTVGAYSATGRMIDVFISICFGVLGFILRIAAVPIAPIVIGVVLGPIFEESLRQGLIITDGHFGAFWSMDRPIALTLIIVAVFMFLVSILGELKPRRRELGYSD